MEKERLINSIRLLPSGPGVYLFKGEHDEIVYIGKAKNLKKRVSDYVQRRSGFFELKSGLIVDSSIRVDFIQTDSELAAMLLEARLIQSHQPRFNVLLKTGQPFVYIQITTGKIPEIKIVRNRRERGTFFGPFLAKGAARSVYDFLTKTFKLKRCNKKIEQGCLNYHMGLCAGSCRQDFDERAYVQRMNLAQAALSRGHEKFLEYLRKEIEVSNREQTFEKSRELHGYYKAFQSVFQALEAASSIDQNVGKRDIWILTTDRSVLYLFDEINGALKKRQVFYFPFTHDVESGLESILLEYVQGFYRTNAPAAEILVNFDIKDHDRLLLEQFLREWHQLNRVVTFGRPQSGHGAALVRLGRLHAEQEDKKRQSLGRALKTFFKLSYEPRTIDCFDVSHKQGMFMVGSSVRFKDGQPDKENLRKFHIKTVGQIDDYASLREIVARRYVDVSNIPDLILIDGGKGQLNAVQDLFPGAEFASLAKREETIYSRRIPEGKKIDPKSFVGQMLIALRDYAHHFAISFHRSIEKL